MQKTIRLLKTTLAISRALHVADNVSTCAVAALTAVAAFGALRTLRER